MSDEQRVEASRSITHQALLIAHCAQPEASTIAREKETRKTNSKRRTTLTQMEPEVAQAAAMLGMRFARWDLLREALSHRSYLNEETNAAASNERLEFLGDAVLGYLVAHYLFHRFHGAPEGQLTRRRVALVSNQTLARWARRIELDKVLLVSKGERGIDLPDRVLGGAFEALLAAILLDRGMEAAEAFFTPILDDDADTVMNMMLAGNHKGRLQEVVQERERMTPTYETVSTIGPDHDRQFVVAVTVGEREIARGVGKSKQIGEQAAAEAALAVYDARDRGEPSPEDLNHEDTKETKGEGGVATETQRTQRRKER